MSEIHKSYEEEAKRDRDYDTDGYNNYLNYQYESYPHGKNDKNEDED